MCTGGIFLVSAATLMAAFEAHSTDVLAAVRTSVLGLEHSEFLPNRDAFMAAPAVAFDHAVMEMFDRGIQLRMGQCHVKRWVDDILPLLLDDADPLGSEDLATHVLPLAEEPRGYDIFQRKEDVCIRVLLPPGRTLT